MYLLILLIPLLNFLFACLFGKFVGRGINIIFLFNLAICVFISFFLFYEVGLNSVVCYIDLGSWFYVGLLKLNWIFLFDSVTVAMILLVVFVSSLVHLYSFDYMAGDPYIIRFVSYLSLFTFFMLVLVTSGTFVQLFLGWEGVGLSSYLLINFWYTRLQANKSAMKAIIVNRFGDFGIYFALLVIFYFFKTFEFSVIFTLIHQMDNFYFKFLNFDLNYLNTLCFFLFLAAIGKSAQLGLHTWLPDAMEGPTPVSALIHAATMVTAGVFVLIRCSPFFEYSPSILLLTALIGGLTAFFAGTAGLVQYDIKKVIAYSTCSQLGYMFFACGMSNYSVGLFHLFNHGFFKALLFLGAGSVIHAILDEQDMRKMGGLVKLLPLTYVIILGGSLALTGFPFLAGFYSKEVVLEIAFSRYSINSFFIYWLGVLAAFITSFYSIRLLYLVFLTTPNSSPRAASTVHESFSFIFVVLFLLGFISTFIGYLFKDLFVGLGTGFWSSAIFQAFDNTIILEAEFLDYYYKLIPLIFSVLGMIISLLFYYIFYHLTFAVAFNNFLHKLYFFFIKKWYFDLIYNNVFVYGFLKNCYLVTFKLIDRGFVEYFGPLSIVRTVSQLSKVLSFFQTGYIYTYIFVIILGIIFFLKLIFAYLSFGEVFYPFNFNLLICFVSILFFLWVNKIGE